MSLSYWLRADVDDLLNEDTFFDSADYSCLLEDTDWAQFYLSWTMGTLYYCQLCNVKFLNTYWRRKGLVLCKECFEKLKNNDK